MYIIYIFFSYSSCTWNSSAFTGKMLNSFHEYESFLLKSNSYKQVTEYCCPLASLVKCKTTTLSSLDYDMSFHTVLESAGLQKSTVLLHSWKYVETNVGTLDGSALSRSLLHAISGIVSSNNSSCQVSCASLMDGAFFPWLWSCLSWLAFVDFTYKSAAECESETRSKRTQPPCDLQSNAGKTLFWQDSHLWPCEGLGSTVGCLEATL